MLHTPAADHDLHDPETKKEETPHIAWPEIRECPDPGGLAEFSVVYTDRALNHMSAKFQTIMRELHATLTTAYGGEAAILVPGGGTYAMEAVARQFVGRGDAVMVIRNGYFSFRWSQIFEKSQQERVTVKKAQPQDQREGPAAFAPMPIEEVVAAIHRLKPAVVFAPQVETAAGLQLPEAYLTAVGNAVHEVGGLFVLDAVAAGCLWVSLKELPVDVLITAPQKGWSAPSSHGIVILGAAALERLPQTQSDSFSMDLNAWNKIRQAYLDGGHAYHATMPTDSIAKLHAASQEMAAVGFRELKAAQHELGRRVRALLASRGLASVAASGFEAPTVVVVHSPDKAIAAKFAKAGVQIAAGVPLMVDHGTNEISDQFQTFRLGLFGLDKLTNIDATVQRLERALDQVLGSKL